MNNKFKRILNNVLNHIADFYFYFFVFYVFSLILSLFFESWKLFFYWPAFHLSAAIFAVLSLFSEKSKVFIQKIKTEIYKVRDISSKRVIISDIKIPNFKFSKIKRPSFDFKTRIPEIQIHLFNFAELLFYFINYFIKKFFILFARIGLAFYDAIKTIISVLRIAIIFTAAVSGKLLKVFIKFFRAQINKISKADFIKIGLTGAVLMFALVGGVEIMNFLILAYGATSVLFIMESRISAAIALAFLMFIPVFLIIGSSSFAEKMAIFAYYFLVIAVFTQIREYLRENSKQELSTKI